MRTRFEFLLVHVDVHGNSMKKIHGNPMTNKQQLNFSCPVCTVISQEQPFMKQKQVVQGDISLPREVERKYSENLTLFVFNTGEYAAKCHGRRGKQDNLTKYTRASER